jgi:hypothetical protein
MFFKNFPSFLYDFNYGNGVTKTAVVKDITRNIRFRKDILRNITMFDEYDIVDGETPEIIAEKFYGTPEYHWVVMLANDKYDYVSDFPMQETYLQNHIKTLYNPRLYSDDWFWDTHVVDGKTVTYIHIKVTGGSSGPFDAAYLTAPVKITLSDETGTFVKVINFPYDEIALDYGTQYFYFPYKEEAIFGPITQFGKGDLTSGVGQIRIYVDTEGRENNPVRFVNSQGLVINGSATGAIPITGAEQERMDNDAKRRIRIISPTLLETVIKNYEEFIR